MEGNSTKHNKKSLMILIYEDVIILINSKRNK